ncbi:MAG TPA: hypothetical protein VIK41_04375 [Gemmatimonadaceae bacterium]
MPWNSPSYSWYRLARARSPATAPPPHGERSRLSRALYGGAKTLAFSLLILAFAPGLFRHIGPIVTWLAYASVYTTVVMCVLRGLPVVAEARHLVRR